MFTFVFKRSRFHFQFQHGGSSGILVTTHLGFRRKLDCLHFQPFSSTGKSPSTPGTEGEIERKKQSFTVSYLINSFGFSPEIAKSLSKKVNFPTPEKPDSVLNLLRDYGFSNLHISKIVHKWPNLLLAHPKKTLLPKLEFYQSFGLSSSGVADLVTSNPRILLKYSLENRMMPCCDFLRSILLLDEKVVSILKRWPFVFKIDVKESFSKKVTLLRQFGVSQPSIMSLLYQSPLILNVSGDKLDSCLREAVSRGFDPLKWTFVEAVYVLLRMNESTWKRKVEVYKSWGWSDNEVHLLFRKHPLCMGLSEKKIMSVMDFLVNDMGFQLASIAKCPMVLKFSLDRRIIPRCRIIRVLMLKGLIKKDIGLNPFLIRTDKRFLDDYVTKYEEQVPELLSIYQEKLGILEPGLDMKGIVD